MLNRSETVGGTFSVLAETSASPVLVLDTAICPSETQSVQAREALHQSSVSERRSEPKVENSFQGVKGKDRKVNHCPRDVSVCE